MRDEKGIVQWGEVKRKLRGGAEALQGGGFARIEDDRIYGIKHRSSGFTRGWEGEVHGK